MCSGKGPVHGRVGAAQERVGQGRQRPLVHGSRAAPDLGAGRRVAPQPRMQGEQSGRVWNCPSQLTAQSVAALHAWLERNQPPWTLVWSRLVSMDEGALPALTDLFLRWADQPVQEVALQPAAPATATEGCTRAVGVAGVAWCRATTWTGCWLQSSRAPVPPK